MEPRGRAASQHSSHGSLALRAVQASPVWLVDHSSVELYPIIIKRCQSWSHILLAVLLITPPLLGSRQLVPAAGTLHCSLDTGEKEDTSKQKQMKTLNYCDVPCCFPPELWKLFRWEVKCLQECDTSPVDTRSCTWTTAEETQHCSSSMAVLSQTSLTVQRLHGSLRVKRVDCCKNQTTVRTRDAFGVVHDVRR